MNFSGRLVLGTFTVVIFTILVLIWGAERTMRASLERDVRTGLEREARIVADLLPPDRTTWQATVTRSSARSGHRIVVRNADGTTAAASDSLLGGNILRVEVPGGPGTIMVAAPLDGVDEAVRLARGSMTGAALLALLVALGLAFVAGRSIATPLVQLSTAARAIAAGTLPRFPRSGVPEIDTLVQALRQMNRQLADRFDELRQEKAGSTAIVEAMGEGIIAADARARIVTANQAARAMLGYEVGEELPDLRTLFRVKGARELVTAVLERGEAGDREIELDGQVLSLHARPMDGGGGLLVLRDLTEVRRLEAVRRDFVANVSHELKTPLTSISGYAETLAGGDVDDPTRERFLATILSNARRMQSLVDDLLDLSRVESGRWVPRPERLDLAALTTESLALFADRIAARQVACPIDLDPATPPLFADPSAVRQILGNLVDNALRYVEVGGTIAISVHPVDGGIELAVADDGIGIPAEHLPRIFERFYRVDPSRSREEGGTGLGLAIVRHMVEAHGGRIRAESAPREGTTIRCWFPARPDVA